MGFLERLMCKHDYICVCNFVADDGYLSSIWRCKHCSKETNKRGHHQLHDSVKQRSEKSFINTPMPTSTRNVRSTDNFMNPLNSISPNYIGNYSNPINEHKAHDCKPSHDSHSHDYGSSSSSSSFD